MDCGKAARLDVKILIKHVGQVRNAAYPHDDVVHLGFGLHTGTKNQTAIVMIIASEVHPDPHVFCIKVAYQCYHVRQECAAGIHIVTVDIKR